MNTALIRAVSSVRNNLELQLEDLAIRRQGLEVDLYYDNSDVHDAVLGLQAFYPPFEDEFAKTKFEEKRTLVRSLAASGRLGKIRLLPPHQAEFLTQLKFYFGVNIPRDPKGDARDFLKDVGLDNMGKLIDLPKNPSKERVLRFIRQQAGLAQPLFKAVQCMVPGHRRLARWEARNVLEFETQKPRYDELVQNKDLIRLKKEFDRRRETTPVNNFADAMAVTILVERVKDFTDGRTATIPRFYLPSPLFYEVLNDTGVSKHLSYVSLLGHTSSVICNSDYYIYKAAFIPRAEDGAQTESRLETVEEYLADLKNKVADVLALQEKLTPEALKQIKDLEGKPLSEIISELQQLSFLENVWLNFDAPQDISEALREVIEASQDLANNPLYRRGVDKAIKVAEAKLNENVEEYKWISSVWFQVEDGAANLRTRVRKGSSSPDEFFRDLGLFRYGFPETTHDHIRTILKEVIAGEDYEREARISVIAASYRGLKDPEGELDSLILASATMLALRTFNELNVMLSKVEKLPHPSLKVIFAEVLFRLRHDRGKCSELIRELEKEYEFETSPAQKANLAIGVSYLYFRLWRSYGGQAPWRHNPEIPEEYEQLCELCINRAIKIANSAFESLGEESLMKKVYTLNQYLYYMLEHGDDASLSTIEEAASELTSFRAESQVWQYRFDDTLARYFHLQAVRASTEVEWEERIKEAKRLSEIALEGSHGDEDVQQHLTEVLMTKTKGFMKAAHP